MVTVLLLSSPYIFIHFPRTCIPQIPSQYSTNPKPDIVILSGELCTSVTPQSKCGSLGPQSYYNRREYVAHHQGRYTLRDNFTTYFHDVIEQGALPAWGKVKILLDALERDEADWIFWIDTDALIVNMDVQLERFIDERYSLIITRDFNYLNAGVFMLRVNDWSRKFMKGVMSKMDATTNEQEWMINLLEESEYKSQKHVKYLPQCSFNSYWHVKTLYEMYRPGDFVVHWAGHNYDAMSFEDWKAGRFIKLPL
ncbi:hypothetical protein BGZ76_006214 [Entomortierella beljakovae]|nr:hypothetical protein BGZ76_006214 [Entomortierella beljakovae]